MSYAIALYWLVTGAAQLKLFDHGHHPITEVVTALAIGWFNIPAVLLAKLAA